jgi:riboflavin synthase
VFTGIVEEVGKVVSLRTDSITVSAGKALEGMQSGGSIAVNGVCLTVTAFDNRSFSADIMPETMKRTNLGLLHAGDPVNLERPLKYGGEMGGHLVQGHIDDTGKIESVVPESEALLMRFVAPDAVMRYIVEKGFVAVDGISLTVVEKDASSFLVSLVSSTRNNTTLGMKKAGDMVNLEVDIIAKYVEQFQQSSSTGVTYNLLKENGFIGG